MQPSPGRDLIKFGVEPMTQNHFVEVAKLFKCVGFEEIPQDELFGRLQVLVEQGPGLSKVAIRNNYVIGAVLCSFNGFSGFIFHLAVNDRTRKAGVGTDLMNACLGDLQNLGARRVNLNCDPALVPYYEKMGFTFAGSLYGFKKLSDG